MNRLLSGRLWVLFICIITILVSCSGRDAKETSTINLVISPYQDLAMIVNAGPLGLEEKYRLTLNIRTIPWQDTLPSLVSARGDVDLGFASLSEFLAKEQNLNRGSNDPLRFIFPVYVFKGGAFITFRTDMPAIFKDGGFDENAMRRFLAARIGLSKNTLYQMLIYRFASQYGVATDDTKIVDLPFDDALLAAQNGDLDVAAVGLPQLAEAEKRGATVLFNMDDIGFADLTGFATRQSVLDKKRPAIEAVIRMWFDSVSHVFQNIDQNSKTSLQYLEKNAATRYTLEEYKRALSYEFFPRTIAQARSTMLDKGGKYYYEPMYRAVAQFLVKEKLVAAAPEKPKFLDLN